MLLEVNLTDQEAFGIDLISSESWVAPVYLNSFLPRNEATINVFTTGARIRAAIMKVYFPLFVCLFSPLTQNKKQKVFLSLQQLKYLQQIWNSLFSLKSGY